MSFEKKEGRYGWDVEFAQLGYRPGVGSVGLHLSAATRPLSKLISSRCLNQSAIRASSGLRATEIQGELSSEAERSKRIKNKKFMLLSVGMGVSLFTGLVVGQAS